MKELQQKCWHCEHILAIIELETDFKKVALNLRVNLKGNYHEFLSGLACIIRN